MCKTIFNSRKMKHMSRSKRSPYPSSHEHGSVEQIPCSLTKERSLLLVLFANWPLDRYVFDRTCSTARTPQVASPESGRSGPGGETDDRLQPTWEVCPNA